MPAPSPTPLIEDFVTAFESLLLDDAHGYSQVRRWGEAGDYDCSSAIVAALASAGFDTGGASWTGNLSDALTSRGWQRLPPDTDLLRGDILLNDACHVALYLGGGSLGEFSCAEDGGIDGAPGDQTGREAYAHPYYDYPWDAVLRCTLAGSGDGASGGPSDGSSPAEGGAPQAITYQAYTAAQGWLPPVTDLSDYAGIPGEPILYLAVDLQGHGWIQACTQAGGWLPPITACDPCDLANGAAGDGSPILALRAYYETPDPAATGYWAAHYRTAPLNRDYYPWQDDTITGPAMDGYAGDGVNPVDRVQITLVPA